MIVNMSEKATEQEIAHVIERIREAGYQLHMTRGVERTIVAAVGNGRREKGELIPLDVKPGDRILFGKYSGNDITIDDEEYMILKEDEILAKIGHSAKAAGGKK